MITTGRGKETIVGKRIHTQPHVRTDDERKRIQIGFVLLRLSKNFILRRILDLLNRNFPPSDRKYPATGKEGIRLWGWIVSDLWKEFSIRIADVLHLVWIWCNRLLLERLIICDLLMNGWEEGLNTVYDCLV